MLVYVVRRLLWGLLIVWGVYTLSFFVVDAAGDPFATMESPKMTPEDFLRLRAKWGYIRLVEKDVETSPGVVEKKIVGHEPVRAAERYVRQLKGLVLDFDLGDSIVRKKPVLELLGEALPNTLLLSGCALLAEFLLGISFGILSAVKRNSATDHAVTATSLFLYSMPGFWLCLMMVLVFAVELRWLPSSGMHAVDAGSLGPVAYVLDVVKHLAMPAFVLGITTAAGVARFQRSAVLEVIRQDYVRTARAKGLDERTVIGKHVLRNALIPVITLLGLSLPFLVSGAVITETIFAWPGMGQQVINAIPLRDIQVVTGFTLIASVMVVVGNILSDVLYAVVDPRVRLS